MSLLISILLALSLFPASLAGGGVVMDGPGAGLGGDGSDDGAVMPYERGGAGAQDGRFEEDDQRPRGERGSDNPDGNAAQSEQSDQSSQSQRDESNTAADTTGDRPSSAERPHRGERPSSSNTSESQADNTDQTRV